ncbi:MAG TPA: R3H domain-containing nucleic acid-binding protein, partial [Candidatus Limnocylindrales bacterium]|nr:R3H domain-containing nucleic acid-binding protein [Candidatus Limnocylindrales bacterium]
RSPLGGGSGAGERGGTRPGFRPGASGSWRPSRSGSASAGGPAAVGGAGGPSGSAAGAGEGGRGGAGGSGGSGGPGVGTARSPAGSGSDDPFVAGEIADRGPLERGSIPAPEPRAREVRELSRQRDWRDSASRAIDALKADEGTGPVNAEDLEARDDDLDQAIRAASAGDGGEGGETVILPDPSSLPTLRVLPQGISRKRLEQAVRELQLPVIVAHDVDEADVVMTIRNEYKQKTPMIREAEERALPIYVLKANSVPQMESSLTSIFALEIDPRDAALRETEEAIGVVLQRSEAVELSPQNAYIRRLQHQMAERANLVSRSRGREPYRRVRLYPDPARSAWR